MTECQTMPQECVWLVPSEKLKGGLSLGSVPRLSPVAGRYTTRIGASEQ